MAEKGQAIIAGNRRPLGYVQIANATLAVATNIPLPTIPPSVNALYALIQANGGTIRWRDDGVAPTAASGMLIPSGGELKYPGDLNAIQLIDGGSGTPIADISIYS